VAEILGKTVQELLDGQPRPLTEYEYQEWLVYLNVKAEKEKEASEKRG